MAVVTPGGLQVRRDPREVFTVIALIRSGKSKPDVLKLLRVCDAIEFLPNTISYVAGMVVLVWTRNWWAAAAALVVGPVGGWLLRPIAVEIPPVIYLSELWQVYYRFILRQPAAIVVAFLIGGWVASLLWIAGSAIATGLEVAISMMVQVVRWKATGVMRESTVISYIRACRLVGAQANTLHLLTKDRIDAAMMIDGVWEPCWEEYAKRMPPQSVRIVARDLELAYLNL